MPTIYVTGQQAVGRPVDAVDGQSVMEVIRGAGFDELLALCGGCCSCATCHVYVGEQWVDRLPEISEDENDLLDSSSNRRPTSRLSCQLTVRPELDGLAVTIAPQD